MFEKDAEKMADERRSNFFLGLGVMVVIALTGVVYLMARSKPQERPALEGVMRAGTAEFDGYKSKVNLEVIEKIVHPNMIGMAQYEVQANLSNRGDRPLTGIELVGALQDLQDNIIARNTSIPIPRVRKEPLKPGETMKISVKIDSPAKVTEADIKDILIELRGLRFQ